MCTIHSLCNLGVIRIFEPFPFIKHDQFTTRLYPHWKKFPNDNWISPKYGWSKHCGISFAIQWAPAVMFALNDNKNDFFNSKSFILTSYIPNISFDLDSLRRRVGNAFLWPENDQKSLKSIMKEPKVILWQQFLAVRVLNIT